MNKLSAAVAALIALVVFSAQVARSQILADVLTLKSGEKVDGRITAESDLSVTKRTRTRCLKQSQRAWLAFRDAEAAFVTDQARGGSMAPTIRYATMTELTEPRIKQLKARLTD